MPGAQPQHHHSTDEDSATAVAESASTGVVKVSQEMVYSFGQLIINPLIKVSTAGNI